MGRYLGPIYNKIKKYNLEKELDKKQVERKVVGYNTSFFTQCMFEKQKFKFYYNLTEKQLKKYILLTKNFENTYKEQELNLSQNLEQKLDSYLIKCNFVQTRREARHLISYGHIFVNQKKIKKSSYSCRPGDYITINPNASKNIINKIKQNLYKVKNKFHKTNIKLCKKTCRIFIIEKIKPREISFKVNEYLIKKYYHKK